MYAFIRRVLMRFRPARRTIPTKAGVFALAAPIFLGSAAINASNNLLFILLGASLGAIVLSGILSERAVAGVDADVEPLGDICAGSDGRFLVRVRRRLAEGAVAPAFGFQIRERLPKKERQRVGKLLDVVLPCVEGRAGKAVATRHFPRRGRVELGRLELATTYPFGLLTKSRDVSAKATVIVRPREVDVPAALADPRGMATGGQSAVARGQGEDIYGLRERAEWDPLHRIHARRSMALDRELVVETEAMRKPMAWLGIVTAGRVAQDGFERTLEVAAATLRQWDRSGYAVGLRTSSAVWSPGSSDLSDLLDAVALLEQGGRPAGQDDGEPLWLVPEGAQPPHGAREFVTVLATGEVRP